MTGNYRILLLYGIVTISAKGLPYSGESFTHQQPPEIFKFSGDKVFWKKHSSLVRQYELHFANRPVSTFIFSTYKLIHSVLSQK